MQKILKKIYIILIAFTFLVPLIIINNVVKAEKNTSLKLYFLEKDVADEILKPRKGLEIFVWMLKDTSSNAQLSDELEKLSDKQLEEKLEKRLYEYTTDLEGKVELKGLGYGKYYIREKNYGEKNRLYSVPLVIDIPNQNTEIYIKTVDKSKTPKIKFNFKKVSSITNEPLENATFKVTKLQNASYEPVLKNGKVYSVTSDKNGLFSVEDIEYGIYYLWETDAPSGYIPLNEPIKFELTEHSIDEEIVIKNKPFNPPPNILIPNTGDTLFIVLLLGGIIIFSVGYRIVKEK